MSSEVRTYDPKLFSLIFGGVPMSGFADGTFFKAVREADNFSDTAGTMGEVARAHQHDRRGEFTFFIQHTSPYNDIISAIAKRDEELNGGIVSIIVKDNGGTTKCAGAKCWVKKWPDEDRAKEVGHYEWVVRVADFETFKGGSII